MALTGGSLGYVDVENVDGLFCGAVLIVDFRGIPMDFRYTDPIKPTRLERVLYGNALEVYLRDELILESLVKAVEVTPTLWICRETDLLGPLKALSRGKALVLASSGHHPLEATGSVESTGEEGVYLIQADSVSAPLRIALPLPSKEEEVRQIAGILVEAAKTMELPEPFSRIRKALASLEED